MAFLNADGIRMMLSTPQGAGEVGANSILYFSVEDIEAVFDALVEKGATAERSPTLAAKMPDHDFVDWIHT